MAHQVQAEHAAATQIDGQDGVWPTPLESHTQLTDVAAEAASPPTALSDETLGYGFQADPGNDTWVHAGWQLATPNQNAQPQ